MGEELKETVVEDQRSEWIEHINSFACPDGSYEDRFCHHALHANGMVVGALGPLGGRQPYAVQAYDEFDTPEKVTRWLEGIDWARQWSASHQFWGGFHCFSESARCTDEWRETVFAWLDTHADKETGWWKRGVEHADRHQALGGFVHIIPIYQHQKRSYPYAERVIDSVLAMQLPSGRWFEGSISNVMTYLELDALYALRVSSQWAPRHRADDVRQAVVRYADLVDESWPRLVEEVLAGHPHHMLAAVGTFGLLQQHLPDRYTDSVEWTDIFSDRRLYQTSEVETLG
jgi:hypothetical protein